MDGITRLQDNDSDWYWIPNKKVREFCSNKKEIEGKEYMDAPEDFDEFTAKWDVYSTGGDPNNMPDYFKQKANNTTVNYEDVSSSEKSIKSFNSLSKIVEQLEKCGYECIGGPLKNNTAFIALKRLAEKELANVGDTIEWTFDNDEHTPDFLRGNTFNAVVQTLKLNDHTYGVYAEYGQDFIGFNDCKIIKRK